MASPGFEPFVEFAVCISSFSEFLQGRGLSGLHQTAHQLEQQVLTLFDDADRYPIPHATVEALNSGLETLVSRVTLFIGTNQRLVSQLAATLTPDASTELLSMPRIWFIGDITPTSETLLTQLTQLKDLGIHTEKHLLKDLSLNAVGPQIFLTECRGHTAG